MQENKQQGNGDICLRSPFFKKLDNYWYHYKWHTIIAFVLMLAVIICSVQMCSKDEYDVEIIYAGPYQTVSNRQVCADISQSFASLAEDRTGDGRVAVNLVGYWVDTDLTLDGYHATDSAFLQQSSATNKSNLQQELLAGNVVIYLLSPSLFQEYDEAERFMRISDLVPDLPEEAYCRYEDGKVNRFGVQLSKTAFGQMTGLASLPKDTVLCIQKKSYTGNIFNSFSFSAKHEYCVSLFKAALSLPQNEQ